MRFPFPAWGQLAERLEERGGLGMRTRPTPLSKGKSQNHRANRPAPKHAHSVLLAQMSVNRPIGHPRNKEV